MLLSRKEVDAGLVEGFLTGDADALRTAWDAWGGMIHRFCARSLPSAADAEDVTQQVFVDAWRGRERFDPELGALPAWLFGIARRKVVDRLRALQRAPVGPRSRARASKRRRASLIKGGLVGVLAFAAVVAFGLSSARPSVVAEAALAPLEGSSVAGSAQLVERGGALELRVDLDAAEGTDRYYELWLLDTSGDRLVSLGPVTGDGVHPLPAGFPVADYPVVDVSSERFDGDPRHSGDSLSRGTLPV